MLSAPEVDHIDFTINPLVEKYFTKKAFEEVFTDRFEFEGVSADSLVSDQPMSNDETLKGATNRLQNIQHLEADYLVSIEGGVDLLDNNYEAFAWIDTVLEMCWSSDYWTLLCSSLRTGVPYAKTE